MPAIVYKPINSKAKTDFHICSYFFVIGSFSVTPLFTTYFYDKRALTTPYD